MKKKFYLFLMAMVITSAITACGNSSQQEATENEVIQDASNVEDEQEIEDVDVATYSIGDTVETNIVRLKLVNAELAIKLNSTSTGTYDDIKNGTTKISDDYFTADEYVASEDVGKAYVANIGHTYVVIEYCVENLDRASVEFDGSFNKQFIFVNYDGKDYEEKTEYGAKSENGYEWEKYNSSNVLLLAGETDYYRCYIDIPVDANSLDDDFDLTFAIPKSDGNTTSFTYHVSANDRAVADASAEKSMTLDEAVYSFTAEEGQNYFKDHQDEYSLMDEDEISSILTDVKFHVDKKLSYGSGEYYYLFESSKKIKETALSLSDKPTGYLNDLSWRSEGNNLVISGKNDTYYELFKVQDGTYVGYENGEPTLLLTK